MSHSERDRSHPSSQDQPQHWLDQAIGDARKRGAFDNLPNTGKPLKLDNLSTASEWDLAFSMLKNAGMSPYWMELGKEADGIEAEMADLRQRTRAFLREHLRAATVSSEAGANGPPQRDRHESRIARRWPFRRTRSADSNQQTEPRFDRAMLERHRLQAQERHHDLAEQLDERLQTYHQALPGELWHLQRIRRSSDEWRLRFEAACPSVYSGDYEAIVETLDESPNQL